MSWNVFHLFYLFGFHVREGEGGGSQPENDKYPLGKPFSLNYKCYKQT